MQNKEVILSQNKNKLLPFYLKYFKVYDFFFGQRFSRVFTEKPQANVFYSMVFKNYDSQIHEIYF